MSITAYEVYDVTSGSMTEATMWGLGLPPTENWDVRPVSEEQKGAKE